MIFVKISHPDCDLWTDGLMDGRMDDRLTNIVALPGAPPLPWLKIT